MLRTEEDETTLHCLFSFDLCFIIIIILHLVVWSVVLILLLLLLLLLYISFISRAVVYFHPISFYDDDDDLILIVRHRLHHNNSQRIANSLKCSKPLRRRTDGRTHSLVRNLKFWKFSRTFCEIHRNPDHRPRFHQNFNINSNDKHFRWRVTDRPGWPPHQRTSNALTVFGFIFIIFCRCRSPLKNVSVLEDLLAKLKFAMSSEVSGGR